MNDNDVINEILMRIPEFSESVKLDECIYETVGDRVIIFKDVLEGRLSLQKTETEQDLPVYTADAIGKIISELRKNGFLVLNKREVHIEKESCEDCPAYQWTVHRSGANSCQLNVQIKEDTDEKGNWTAKPVQPCIRPLSVGASYLIARELSLPEPMVGKIDKEQYAKYCRERNQ